MDHYRPKRLRIEKSSESCEIITVNTRFEEKTSTAHDLCSDVWQQIFQYFEIIELFMTFAHITDEIDQILFNENNNFLLRGLILDADVQVLPSQIPLNRVISLTLHDTSCHKIIEHCSELRSLKLTGTTEWVTSMIRKISQKNTKLEQLTLIMPEFRSLPQLLTAIFSIFSLRRLEICADDLKEKESVCTEAIIPNRIEQFVFHSCSTINWNDLSCMLPTFINIHLLSISLLDRNQKSIPSFNFRNLHTLSLGLLEVSFNWIIQLVATIPCLVKLKLSGLVDGEGFVVKQRWGHLFESAPTLVRIFVNVSLDQGKESYHCEKIQGTLRALNLNLICNDDDNDCYLYYGKIHRWWNLKGMITKK